MKYEILKEWEIIPERGALGAYKYAKKLILAQGSHYLASEIFGGELDTECLVFKCSESGEVVDWSEVAGFRRGGWEEAKGDFEKYLCSLEVQS